jgi:hypothetical protein
MSGHTTAFRYTMVKLTKKRRLEFAQPNTSALAIRDVYRTTFEVRPIASN